ncbi:thioredoxin family protein [Salirhabdus sp. Marseille-P4669]|uniref:thioredoxin family protein n=1 Tax=Salirhabdus sp. Marseille-P4669 TaxID=2042310 RepID=UPI000C79E716|nr:thioredoxin family protein [Salirhabdus sp. Marseille-P4669]
MKKLVTIGLIVIVLFGGLIALVQYQKSQEPDYYYNQITPTELQTALDNGETTTVYFYSPECVHCQEATPIVVPLTEDLDVDMKKVNVLEYEEAWQQFGIKGTPTIKHYENGKEVAKLESVQTREEYKAFFEEYVLD